MCPLVSPGKSIAATKENGVGGFFHRVVRYAPTKDKTQTENICTETLAYLLNKYKEFQHRVALAAFSVQNFNGNVETQCRFEGEHGRVNIPDIVFEDNHRDRYILEVKVDSPVDEGQLRRYQQHGKEVALLARNKPSGISEVRFISWQEIGDHLKQTVAGRGEIGKDFLLFLGDKGMHHSKPLTAKEVCGALSVREVTWQVVLDALRLIEKDGYRLEHSNSRRAPNKQTSWVGFRIKRGRRSCWIGESEGYFGIDVYGNDLGEKLKSVDRRAEQYKPTNYWLSLDFDEALKGTSIPKQIESMTKYLQGILGKLLDAN